ncbi:hypothetical protein D3C76_630190 [compost metagenome]
MTVQIAQAYPVPAACNPQQLAVAQGGVEAVFGKTALQQWFGKFADLFQALE